MKRTGLCWSCLRCWRQCARKRAPLHHRPSHSRSNIRRSRNQTAIPEAQAPAQQPAPEPQAPVQQPPTEQPSAPARKLQPSSPRNNRRPRASLNRRNSPRPRRPHQCKKACRSRCPRRRATANPRRPTLLSACQGQLIRISIAPAYITNRRLPERQYVAAGWGSPHQTKYTDGEYVYLSGGSFQEGAMYEIVRKLRDPNRWEMYAGQRGAIANAGPALCAGCAGEGNWRAPQYCYHPGKVLL